MLFVDANAILRYLLYDNADMADKVCKLIEKNKIFIRYEVFAEVVYVLNKVYSMPRAEIAGCAEKFLRLSNVEMESEQVLFLALKTYAEVNIDPKIPRFFITALWKMLVLQNVREYSVIK